MDKIVLSFYCDDTNPYVAPPEAFKTFLDFVSSEGIAGESSVILGFEWNEHGLLSQPSTKTQSDYLEQVQRAFTCGIDSQFELMTHDGLFDFTNNLIPEGVIHEGLWLFETAVTVDEYEAYFENILYEGERVDIQFTGLTQPGCSCDACKRRHSELGTGDQTNPNPNVWQALLNLTKKGKFRGHTVPCFFGGTLEHGTARRMASDGLHAVVNLPPNMEDRLGLWLNASDWVDTDYYITNNGQSGRIVDLVRAQAPYGIFYTHWQDLNPVNGVGWEAFTQVVRRVQMNLHQEVIWMRPSEYTDQLIKNQSRAAHTE